MKTAVFGGSFNPIHLGHLALAREVVNLGYQRIIFVPARKPPHKNGGMEVGVSARDRLQMLALALETMTEAVLWDGELNRPGPSYSIDTLDELRRIGMVSGRPGFIIGDDLIAGFPSWKESDRLAESTLILLGRRTGREDYSFPYPHQRLRNPIWPHSSTQVREIIASGGAPDSVVPDSISAYIREHGLYGFL